MRTFADSHPFAAAAYFAAAAGVAMFSMDPVVLGLSLAGALAMLALLGGLRPLGSHGWMLGLFIGMAVINPLTHHDGVTVLVVVNHNPVTLEACLYGLAAAGMITASLYWFRCFSRLMTSDRLLTLLSGLSPGLSLVVSMGLRYVPLFGRQLKNVQMTQRALGLYGEEAAVDRLRGGVRVFSVMTTWALENGVITADSMTARGYGLRRRSHFRKERFTLRDGVLTGLSAILAALALWGAAGRSVTYYPAFVMSPVTVRAGLGYGAYAALMLLPHVIHAKEAIRWHFWK